MHSGALSQELLDSGIRSVAVVFKHAAIYPEHELAVGRVAAELGFEQVQDCSIRSQDFFSFGDHLEFRGWDL